MLFKFIWRRIFRPVIICLFTSFLKGLKLLTGMHVGVLHYTRIGHLGENTELYLRLETRNKCPSRKRSFFLSGKPANRQLLTMIKRRMQVVEVRQRIPIRLQSIFIECLQRAEMYIDLMSLDHHAYYAYNNIPSQLAFTEEEEIKGERLLQRLGIKPGAPFVCFHARDSRYLNTLEYSDDWTYQDFRDCDIQNYLPAAKYLNLRGIPALRMGSVVESALPESSSGLIDYAIRHRTDFGDIFLLEKCKFFLGNTAGICCLGWIFKKPSAFANFPHSGIPPFFKNDLFIVKKPWLVGRKRFLTFREVFENGIDEWWRGEMFVEAGIELVENTSHEICALAKEMNARIDGTWVITEEDEELQVHYRSLFPPDHPAREFPSRMGAEFLRQNQELLD